MSSKKIPMSLSLIFFSPMASIVSCASIFPALMSEAYLVASSARVSAHFLPFSAYKMFIEAFEPPKRAALFDLDGVILDTESQYDIIWGRIGKKYHPEMPDFHQTDERHSSAPK